MPPRKTKPASVKKATGNPGKRPIQEVRLPFTGEAKKPEYLGRRPRASQLWDEFAPALRILGTLKLESAPLFAQWCWLMSSFEEAPDAMPSSKIANMRALASMIGMDPSSQGKFSTPAGDDKDPAAEFFSGPRAVNE